MTLIRDRENFFKVVRQELFGGTLSTTQVSGMEQVLNTWEQVGYSDLRWLAYMLATIYHETAKTMQPIEEYGKGKGRKYGTKVKMGGQPYTSPDKLYYGRGFVQLTWYDNYENMSRIIFHDGRLVVEPELALDLKTATLILFEGMTKGVSSFGDFTGKSLETYFNATTDDPIGARRIINGQDKARTIAGYHKIFLRALA